MAKASRDERRLMRQRGAGTRNINNNIELDLLFPTPTTSQRSKTPLTNRRASRRVIQTPARRSVSTEPTTAAPTVLPAPPTARRASKRKNSFLDAVTEGAEPPTGKKRKVGDAAATPSGASFQGGSYPLNVSQHSVARRRSSRKSVTITIAEERSDDGNQAPAENAEVRPDQGLEESVLDLQEDKENDEPIVDAPQVKRKKRKATSRNFTRPKKRSSTGSLQEQHAPSHRTSSESHTTRDEDPRHLSAPIDVSGQSVTLAPMDAEHGLPVSVRYRNGVAIPTKAPRAAPRLSEEPEVAEAAPLTEKTAQPLQSSPLPAEDKQGDVEDSILSIQSNGAKKRRKRKSIVVKKKSRRRVSAQSTASMSPFPRHRQAPARTASPAATTYREVDENEDETYIPDEGSPDPPTPAVSKKSRKNTRIVPSIESGELVRRSNSTEPKKTGFPITTHRLSNIAALPTIKEEHGLADCNDEEDDELQGRFGISRTAPNAVDVLAQICRETVASTLANTRTSTSGSKLKRRTDALESFGEEIESRLFDMSAAVENRLTLEARVRTSKREKSETQAQWIEVRRKREEVALRMDRVRQEHWTSEEQAAATWKLSEGLHGVEILMEREKGTETESLEYLLRTVGASVSGHRGGGILQQVKSFNAQMERLVELLEG